MKNDNRGDKVNERVIYVSSYSLSKKDPSRLSIMSLETAKIGLEMMKKGLGTKIVFSTAYDWWEKEAELKKSLAREYGIGDHLIEIIPHVTNSYNEAEGLKKIVSNPNAIIVLIAQECHARRAAKVLRYYFKNVEAVKVSTGMERQLDPSWLKSILGTSTKTIFILWNWFFYIITPLMVKRQMRKQKGG